MRASRCAPGLAQQNGPFIVQHLAYDTARVKRRQVRHVQRKGAKNVQRKGAKTRRTQRLFFKVINLASLVFKERQGFNQAESLAFLGFWGKPLYKNLCALCAFALNV
jgi:hypothetical protein